ncbi:MAG: 16S rRNA (adenine(1518)-N(6)/adenine(1519)-N(6))-dimethyltransferase RsmA [Acidimicrobiia bacterium]
MVDDGTQARSEIRRLLAAHDHRPTYSFGQNFLADPNIVRRIVAESGLDASSQVVEIGAGTGTITSVLADHARTVVAYEIDESLSPILAETLAEHENIELRFEDASRIRLDEALDPGTWTMVGNLPYNVGTGIVLDTLKHAPRVTRIVVMVQREVADRLLADAGSKTYGLPSVTAGLHAEARFAFSVPPQVFEPQPRVDSAVIVFDRKVAPSGAERAIELASAAFGQRRKMLRRSLLSVVADPEATLARAGIDPTARPEQLTPLAFVDIAHAEDQDR